MNKKEIDAAVNDSSKEEVREKLRSMFVVGEEWTGEIEAFTKARTRIENELLEKLKKEEEVCLNFGEEAVKNYLDSFYGKSLSEDELVEREIEEFTKQKYKALYEKRLSNPDNLITYWCNNVNSFVDVNTGIKLSGLPKIDNRFDWNQTLVWTINTAIEKLLGGKGIKSFVVVNPVVCGKLEMHPRFKKTEHIQHLPYQEFIGTLDNITVFSDPQFPADKILVYVDTQILNEKLKEIFSVINIIS